MQFLAFLRDSYREARNGWMLQLMLALAALLVLLVASIGFRPSTVDDLVGGQLRFMNWGLSQNPANYDQMGRPTFAVEGVTATDPGATWKSDYAFDFVVKCPSAADMRKARATGLPATADRVRQFLRGQLRDFARVDVAEEVPADAAAFLAVGGGALAADPPWAAAETRFHATAAGNQVDDPLAWPHRVSILFAYEIPLFSPSPREGAYQIESWLVGGAGAWVALLVAVVITAGFIPNMLAKGSFDLLVSKPVGRSRLLVYKYVGGLTFVFVLTSAAALGVWAAVGLRTGFWTPHFLAIIPILTFYFAVLYAVSTAAAVLTRSAIVAILITGLAWAGFWVVGKVNSGIADRRAGDQAERATDDPDGPRPVGNPFEADPDRPLWGFIPKAVWPYATALHAVTPRTSELDDRLGRVIAEGVLTPYQLKKAGYDKPPRETWGEIIGVTLAFIAVVLGLCCWRVETRDF